MHMRFMNSIFTLLLSQFNTLPGLYANMLDYHAFDIVDIGEEFAIHKKVICFLNASKEDLQTTLFDDMLSVSLEV